MEYRTKIINTIADKIKAKKYLEIGFRNPKENFNYINCDIKDGVDPEPVTLCNYRMTSDEFFKKYSHDKEYDLVFVDGMHTAEQVYKDVMNSIEILSDNGFIVIHDCNPPTEFHTRSYNEYLKTRGQWYGDVYKGFIKLKEDLKDYSCFVIDEDCGCGIITKSSNFNIKNSNIKDPSGEYNWKFFNNNRECVLCLTQYNEFVEKLSN